jgi:hypothetical protein
LPGAVRSMAYRTTIPKALSGLFQDFRRGLPWVRFPAGLPRDGKVACGSRHNRLYIRWLVCGAKAMPNQPGSVKNKRNHCHATEQDKKFPRFHKNNS